LEKIFKKMDSALKHLYALHKTFVVEKNFNENEKWIYEIYKHNHDEFDRAVNDLKLDKELYSKEGRQMILADLYEYIFLGRGYYSLKKRKDRGKFIRLILRFVNLLMCYEILTVSDNLRNLLLEKLREDISELKSEKQFNNLKSFRGKIGLPRGEIKVPYELNKYFDSILPKTTGGLWHELLVYIFLIRNDIGYIMPLLLLQRIFGITDHIIPPDFLVFTYDKNIYGVEVGVQKELQSSSFIIKSKIPTIALNTIDSRISDRCPICRNWIPICNYVINQFSNLDKEIDNVEVKCLEECDVYCNKDDVAKGSCPYTKYSRHETKTYEYTQHKYADGKHYHYKCVLKDLPEEISNKIIKAKDNTALKTHFPYYSGIETLLKE